MEVRDKILKIAEDNFLMDENDLEWDLDNLDLDNAINWYENLAEAYYNLSKDILELKRMVE